MRLEISYQSANFGTQISVYMSEYVSQESKCELLWMRIVHLFWDTICDIVLLLGMSLGNICIFTNCALFIAFFPGFLVYQKIVLLLCPCHDRTLPIRSWKMNIHKYPSPNFYPCRPSLRLCPSCPRYPSIYHPGRRDFPPPTHVLCSILQGTVPQAIFVVLP